MKLIYAIGILIIVAYIMVISMQQLSIMLFAPEYCHDKYIITWCEVPEKGK